MNGSRDKILFWTLMAVQAAGCQIILWIGLPLYRRLVSGGTGVAGNEDIAVGMAATVIMQVSHWSSLRLMPRLRFRRNSIFGHILVCIGELSLFFANALAVVVLFDRGEELQIVYWKLLVLIAILFAVSSYKNQIQKLGDRLMEGDTDPQ